MHLMSEDCKENLGNPEKCTFTGISATWNSKTNKYTTTKKYHKITLQIVTDEKGNKLRSIVFWETDTKAIEGLCEKASIEVMNCGGVKHKM